MTTPNENSDSARIEELSREKTENSLEHARAILGYSGDNLATDGNPSADESSEEVGQSSPRTPDEIFAPSIEATLNVLRASTSLDAPLTVAIDVTEFDAGYWSETSDPTAEGYDAREEPALRESKLAVISAVNTPVPVILGIEPLEKSGLHEHEKCLSLADVVQSLLEQATQHVEIDTVLADRGFHAQSVITAIERRGLTYIIPAHSHPFVRAVINETTNHGSPDYAVARDVTVPVAGQTYTTNFVLVRQESAVEDYVVFLTNTKPSDDALEEIPNRYTQRWQIENQGKTLRTRLETKSLPEGLQCQDYLAAAAEVNAYSLVNHLLKEQSDERTGRYVLGFDHFLQSLHWDCCTSSTSRSATDHMESS